MVEDRLLVRGTDAAAVVAVELLVKQQVVLEVRIVLQLRMLAERRPSSPRRKMQLKRRVSSSATCSMVMKLPDPVGHSILKSSP